MDREALLWRFARLLIAKHGKVALHLARSRAQRWVDLGDYRALSGWARVTDVQKRMTVTGAPRVSEKGPLDEPSIESSRNLPAQQRGIEAWRASRKNPPNASHGNMP
jgi:hypothetical protein